MFHMDALGPLRLLCGGILFLLFWAVVIGLIVWVVRAWSRPRAGQSGGTTTYTAPPASGEAASSNRALDIIRERYARGEITKEQYEEMRRDLQS